MKGTFTEGMKHEQALDLIADALWRAGRDLDNYSKQPRPTQEHYEEAVLLLPLILSRLEEPDEREPAEPEPIGPPISKLLCEMVDEIAELRKATIFEVMADYGLQVKLVPKDAA